MIKPWLTALLLAASAALAADPAATERAATTYAALETCVSAAKGGGAATVDAALGQCTTEFEAAVDADIAASGHRPHDNDERDAMRNDRTEAWTARFRQTF